MNRHVMRLIFAAPVLLGLVVPAEAKTSKPAPYRLQPLKCDVFPALTVLETQFGGDYTRVAFVRVAESDQVALTLIEALPEPPQEELTFEHNGRALRYFAVGDLSKPAKMIFVYVHGLG